MGDYFERFINEEARTLPRKTANEEVEETVTIGWTLPEVTDA